MSTTNENTTTAAARPKGVAVNAAESLELLQSAIWHCRQNGLRLSYVNKSGTLWLGIAGAELSKQGDEMAIRPIVAEPEPA